MENFISILILIYFCFFHTELGLSFDEHFAWAMSEEKIQNKEIFLTSLNRLVEVGWLDVVRTEHGVRTFMASGFAIEVQYILL